MIKDYDPKNIRNITIIGHNNTGKTTLTEALLFMGGALSSKGSVEEKNTASDFTTEEKERGISIHSAVLYVESEDVKVNIIDTPGMSDFVGDVRASLRVAEGAIVLVDAVEGMEMETEKIWKYADEYHIPRSVFVNKMDKEKADFFKVISDLQQRFSIPVIPIEIPIGQGESFQGVIDLVRMKAVFPKDNGREVHLEEIPADLLEQAKEYRQKLAEAVAETDDRLIEKFLDEQPLTRDEIEKGLLDVMRDFKVIPVMCGSALKNIGIVTLLRNIVHEAPSPIYKGAVSGIDPNKSDDIIERKPVLDEPFSAFVFKTTQDQYSGKMSYIRVRSGELRKGDEIYNPNILKKEKINHLYFVNGRDLIETDRIVAGGIGVLLKLEDTRTGHTLCDQKEPIQLPALRLPKPIYSLSVSAHSKNEDEKFFQLLQRIAEEDPTFHVSYNPEIKQTIIDGMGDFHLRLYLESIEAKHKIKSNFELPRIAYRETITKAAEARYKHKKQSGGHGQYGEVAIKIQPLQRGQGFEFVDRIVGGVIPKQYIPGVQKGLEEAMVEGVLANYPVQDVQVFLVDGSHHSVDSSEYSFKLAGIGAFNEASKKASPVLLEPVMRVIIQTDKSSLGDILGDLNGRRAKVLGMEDSQSEGNSSDSDSAFTTVEAHVPHAEMLSYAIDLRSMTSGRASFSMEFSHYEVLQGRLAQDAIEKNRIG